MANKGSGFQVSTGLFTSSKPGLLLGYLKGEYMQRFIKLVKEASKDTDKGLVLFMNKEKGPDAGKKPFYVVFDLGQDNPSPKSRGKQASREEDDSDDDDYNW